MSIAAQNTKDYNRKYLINNKTEMNSQIESGKKFQTKSFYKL